MTAKKGGYHVDGRLETTRDELVMEALLGANHPSDEVRARTFAEIARLARKYAELLEHILSGAGDGPTSATASA